MGLRTNRYGPRMTRWRGGSIGAGVPRPVTANSHRHQKYPPAPAARSTRPTIDPASHIGAGMRRAAIHKGMSTPAVPGTRRVNRRFFSSSIGQGDRTGYVRPRSACGGRRLPDALEPGQVLLAELGHLRRDDHPAVALVGISPEVLLMIVLGRIKGFGRDDLGHDRIVVDLSRVELGNHFICDLLL